jgi:hypothetical protein
MVVGSSFVEVVRCQRLTFVMVIIDSSFKVIIDSSFKVVIDSSFKVVIDSS